MLFVFDKLLHPFLYFAAPSDEFHLNIAARNFSQVLPEGGQRQYWRDKQGEADTAVISDRLAIDGSRCSGSANTIATWWHKQSQKKSGWE